MIIVIVEPGMEGEHHTYQLNKDETPLQFFERWKGDRSYRQDIEGIKIYEMIDITKTILK